jgi:tripartite-type tricarboxylate transporter receptor subunit TctC
MSPQIVNRINEELIKALREKDSKEQLGSEGISDVVEMSPEAFTAFFQKRSYFGLQLQNRLTLN